MAFAPGATHTPLILSFIEVHDMARSHRFLRYFSALFFCGGLLIGFVSGQDTGDTKKAPPPPKDWKLPVVLEKGRIPASVEELRDIEKHVQQVLKKVMPCVVGLQVGMGQGSGVIINEDGTILT